MNIQCGTRVIENVGCRLKEMETSLDAIGLLRVGPIVAATKESVACRVEM